MKAEKAPKHSQKIVNNYVLWFKSTNSYVVISENAYNLLKCYFESKDKDSYIEHLKEHFNLSDTQADAYCSDFTAFLEDITSESSPIKDQMNPEIIPITNSSYCYTFGNSNILINYASEKLVQLIHPYLQHASVQEFSNADTVFDIFSEGERLYLFKNKSLLGNYETSNFHFLQGKFAMELVTSIYNNTESDWLGTFHASTICNDKEAIMIIGDSGNGKSTLSAVLMSNGYDLLADDFTPMLAENQHLYRFPAAIQNAL